MRRGAVWLASLRFIAFAESMRTYGDRSSADRDEGEGEGEDGDEGSGIGGGSSDRRRVTHVAPDLLRLIVILKVFKRFVQPHGEKRAGSGRVFV